MKTKASSVVPRLTTERLLLRELRIADFEAYAANCADPNAMKYMSGVVDRRMSWRLFAALSGAWLVTGSGWWAIEEIATGTYIGTVGAFVRETQLGLGREGAIELGWSLHPPAWGKGYASEAAKAALDWAFSTQDVARAIAHMDPGNVASARVAEKIGMTCDGDAEFYGLPSLRYSIPRPR